MEKLAEAPPLQLRRECADTSAVEAFFSRLLKRLAESPPAEERDACLAAALAIALSTGAPQLLLELVDRLLDKSMSGASLQSDSVSSLLGNLADVSAFAMP